ncbi:MAG: L-histidine N(alpha)-methyltransferase, partial [Burkholderiales bacterium]
ENIMRTAQTRTAASYPENFRFVSIGGGAADHPREIVAGLLARRKTLPPQLFYDARGSELFNAICRTEAYYLTRTEREIFLAHSHWISNAVGINTAILEFGPGDMSKIRLLLRDLRPTAYLGVDVSKAQLHQAGADLARAYPWLQVIAVCGDFRSSEELSELVPKGLRKVAFFPGSTIGNFEPHAAKDFLGTLRALTGSSGAAIIGVDFKKDKSILDLAYNDPEGYTRAFNLNLLTRLNREFGADFDERRFRHHAFYNEALGRVEMHLVSVVAQQVRFAGGETVRFEPGESIHTENSYKYAPEEFVRLANDAGFGAHRLFTDKRGWFGVFVLTSGG